MPRRSYTAYTRQGPHLVYPGASLTLCGVPVTFHPLPATPAICPACKDWAYPLDPYRNR